MLTNDPLARLIDFGFKPFDSSETNVSGFIHMRPFPEVKVIRMAGINKVGSNDGFIRIIDEAKLKFQPVEIGIYEIRDQNVFGILPNMDFSPHVCEIGGMTLKGWRWLRPGIPKDHGY